MNNTTIIGRIVREVEVKTAGKTVVVNNTIAINNGKDKEATFVPIVAWGKTAELLAKYFHKGDGIALEGRLQSRSFEKDGQKRTVLEVVVNSVHFLPTNKGDAGAAPAAAAAAPAEEDDLF